MKKFRDVLNLIVNWKKIRIFFFSILIILFTYYLIKLDPILCEGGDDKFSGAAKAAKGIISTNNVNPNVYGNTLSLQTQTVNVNIPSTVLNNIGLGGTIIGGMKIGSGMVKGGSPLAKVGFAVGGAILGGGIHTVYTTMNKISNTTNNVNRSSNNGTNGPFTTSSIIENNKSNNFFSIEDVLNLLNWNLIIRIVIVYLLYTLFVFFIGTLISNTKISLNWIKNLYFGNRISPVLEKLFNIWSKSSITFFLLNWIILLFSHLFLIYFYNWFIVNFNFICLQYAKLKEFDEISNIEDIPGYSSGFNYFTNTNIIDYLNSNYVLDIVIVFLLFIIMYIYVSMLVINNKLNVNLFKSLPFGINIHFILVKSFNDWNKISFIFLLLIFMFLFISCFLTAYYWYWFVQDFDIICYEYVNK